MSAGWLAAAVVVVVVAAVALYWLLVITEGAYLGPRAVSLLYDRYAGRYDRIKEFDPAHERHFVGDPVARFLTGLDGGTGGDDWILDVAAGSGRFAEAVRASGVRSQPVVCLDRSAEMLRQARRKLDGPNAAGTSFFLQHDASPLPFPSGCFAVVACLEALEFMPAPLAVIDELVRVARPGGLLLLTNRTGWQARLFPGKRFSRARLADVLRQRGCGHVSITPWQVDYDRVLAVKEGVAGDAPAGSWPAVVRCRCPQSQWQQAGGRWHCPVCGTALDGTGGLWRLTASKN